MTGSPSNVVELADYRKPPKSQYELFPLSFFDAEKRSTWEVKPTGTYSDDYWTGNDYAIEFLESCDGSAEWASLLAQIVDDMICAEFDYGRGNRPIFAMGPLTINGVVAGFMEKIGRILCRRRNLDAL
jgi:hypothetical protein